MNKNENDLITGLEIAVIGMSGRFPGARNIGELLENLKNGIESISFFCDEELEKSGSSPELIQNPNYVKAGGILENIGYFDASFFDYTPREAKIMNPQMQLFHECAWEALEDASLSQEDYDGLIGMYAGSNSTLTWEVLCELSGENKELGGFAASHLNSKDFISTKIAYNLNLKGPSFSIYTACSTSLVAIHLACQGILSGECDVALAGGVRVEIPQKSGYFYMDGMVESPDGHVRAFDADARGTVITNGIGVVVLKRLEYAVKDRDNILALVKGSAMNNDGSRKVGFTAPSVEGQAEVIRTAYQAADVDVETVSYIETHGTGTTLGDPIEIEALKKAFNSNKKQFCAIGSVKTNLGHLDVAGGVTAFIKTVLSLKYRVIFPSLHYNKPNPRIDFENSPFYVNTKLTSWEINGYPLRAGVSGMGVGGTNVHIVLEETPEIFKLKEASPSRQHQLLMLSAKTQSALDKATENLAEFLEKNKEINLADVAYTLQVGRKDFQYRRMLVCSGIDETLQAFSSPGSAAIHTYRAKEGNIPVIFMFPGQGAQYVNMGRELYQTELRFREEMDRCFDLLESIMGYDIKEILYPPPDFRGRSPYPPEDCVQSPQQSDQINRTEIAQPVIFVLEYALARLLMHWGIVPDAMIGHSIGEYVAACLADVFSLEDALTLVALRGKLMQQMPPGAMLGVSAAEEELLPLLKENREISLAAVNSSVNCVVSGPRPALESFEKDAAAKGYTTRWLHTSHAFHSNMMEPMTGEFKTAVKQFPANPATIPYISNLTGKWITWEDLSQPGYWTTHLKKTVRFADGLGELLKEEPAIFVEVGPGNVLNSFLKKHPDKKEGHLAVNLLRHPKENISDTCYLANQIGHLWLYGSRVNWKTFYDEEKRNKVALPTYPFERKRCWGEMEKFKCFKEIPLQQPRPKKNPDIANWFYTPLWKQSLLPSLLPGEKPGENCWLIFADQWGLGTQLAKELEKNESSGNFVITVKQGTEFSQVNQHEYSIDPGQSRHYDTLIRHCHQIGKIPNKIFHLWSITPHPTAGKTGTQKTEPIHSNIDDVLDLGFYSLLYLAQAIGKENISDDLQIHVVTNNMQAVNDKEEWHPGQATVLGAVKVIPLEYPNIKCRCLDIDFPAPVSQDNEELVNQLAAENNWDSPGEVVAYRGSQRWVQIYEPVHLKEAGELIPQIRKQGNYLITGGLGGIGLRLAEYLAKTFQAHLILTGRSAFPAREEWNQLLENTDTNDPLHGKIKKLQAMETSGAKVMILCADIAREEQMREVFTRAEKHFGKINGIIHAAGVADYGGVIQRRTPETTAGILAPKVKGTLILDRLLKERNMKVDFFVLFSSVSTILAPFGECAYVAANAFLDAFAHYKNHREEEFTISINWGTWQEVGMSVEAVKRYTQQKNLDIGNLETFLANGISPLEGIDAFNRIMQVKLSQVVVFPEDLYLAMQRRNIPDTSITREESENETPPGFLAQRPQLSNEYVPPENSIEQIFGDILGNFLQVELVGVNDNFFELGLNSLDMVQVNNKLKQAIDRNIPVALWFEYPTIRSLAQHLEQKESEENDTLAAVERTAALDKGKNKLKQLKQRSRVINE